MRGLAVLFLALASLLCPGKALNIPSSLNLNLLSSPNLTDFSGLTQNIVPNSNFPNDVPTYYKTTYSIGGDPLDFTECMLQAAYSIQMMALKDQWQTPIPRIENYEVNLPGTGSHMVIQVVPGRDDCERRYAIWAVYFGLLQMWKTQEFAKTITTMWWNGYDMGEVRFLPKSPVLSLNVGNTSNTLAVGQNTPALGNVSEGLGSDETLQVYWHNVYVPPIQLQKEDFIFSLMASLVRMASIPSSTIVKQTPCVIQDRSLQGFRGTTLMFEPRDLLTLQYRRMMDATWLLLYHCKDMVTSLPTTIYGQLVLDNILLGKIILSGYI